MKQSTGIDPIVDGGVSEEEWAAYCAYVNAQGARFFEAYGLEPDDPETATIDTKGDEEAYYASIKAAGEAKAQREYNAFVNEQGERLREAYGVPADAEELQQYVVADQDAQTYLDTIKTASDAYHGRLAEESAKGQGEDVLARVEAIMKEATKTAVDNARTKATERAAAARQAEVANDNDPDSLYAKAAVAFHKMIGSKAPPAKPTTVPNTASITDDADELYERAGKQWRKSIESSTPTKATVPNTASITDDVDELYAMAAKRNREQWEKQP